MSDIIIIESESCGSVLHEAATNPGVELLKHRLLASLDLDVGDVHGRLVVALLLAARRAIKPAHVDAGRAPTAHGEGHALLEVNRLLLEVATGAVLHGHVKSEAVLSQLRLERVSVVGRRHGEGLQRVDLLVGTVLTGGVGLVLALASTVAGVVLTLGVGRVTDVRGGSEGVRVGLLSIELGAPGATNVVSVTVVVLALRRSEGAILLEAGHERHVEGSVAAALVRRQVEVVADRATVQVRSVPVVGAEGVGVSKVAATSVLDLDLLTLGAGVPLRADDVKRLLLAILSDGNSVEGGDSGHSEGKIFETHYYY